MDQHRQAADCLRSGGGGLRQEGRLHWIVNHIVHHASAPYRPGWDGRRAFGRPSEHTDGRRVDYQRRSVAGVGEGGVVQADSARGDAAFGYLGRERRRAFRRSVGDDERPNARARKRIRRRPRRAARAD